MARRKRRGDDESGAASDAATPVAPLTALEASPPRPRPSRAERRTSARAARQAGKQAGKQGAPRTARGRPAPAPTVAAAGSSSGVATGAPLKWYQRSVGRTVSSDLVAVFSRQLASFIEAGISIVEALEIVAEESSSEVMAKVVREIRESIQRGGSFSDAVGAHPLIFPGYYRAMIRSAEYTGRVDDVLNQLATYLERDILAKRQVKSALTYPTMVLVVAIAAMIVMAIFVLPKFAGMYRSLGADLPLPTRMLLGLTDFLTASWYFLLASVGGVVLLGSLVFGGDRGKPRRDRLAMRLPVVGPLFHMISVERFCRVLAALANAGVPLPEAIEMSALSTNNTVFMRRLESVRDALLRGGGLSAPMVETGIFPVAARQMIRVGERTGTLGRQLSKAAGYYEREVGFKMKRATDLFQPAVILFVGALVGFVAIAQVAAMYSVFSQVHG